MSPCIWNCSESYKALCRSYYSYSSGGVPPVLPYVSPLLTFLVSLPLPASGLPSVSFDKNVSQYFISRSINVLGVSQSPAWPPSQHFPRSTWRQALSSFLLEPLFFSWNIFLFLTLRKLVREGILGIIWFYLISLRRWVSWNSGGDEMHPNLWSKWGVQSEPKPGSGLLARNSPQDTPESLKTACPMVDAVSFCCSAVTSWRAGTVAYFSKFSPVAWPICSRHTWLLNWAWRGKQNWKTWTILSQMLAECFFICCLSSMMMMMMTMMMMMCVCMCVCVLAAQLCLTLCEPMNCSLPGSSVHGILQARTLEWIAIPFFRGSSPPRDRTQVSCIAGRFFTVWATREAFPMIYPVFKIQGQHGFITFPIHFKWTFLRFPVSFAE